MVFVDIVVANIWMAILLIGIGKRKKINKWLKADTAAIENLKENGILKGSVNGFKRILSCHPIKFLGGGEGFDPVKKKK